MNQEQQWLINCLNATLDIDQKVRSFAEASLQQASLQPGFGIALSGVAANRDISLGLRQLAAVLLKQFIKKHWKEDEESFEHPVASSEEKETIRKLLLVSIDEPHRKICTAVCMAVATVAQFDWPEDWPDLLPYILKLISDQSNANAVHGALRCLALLSADFDDNIVPSLLPIFPCLHAVVSSHQLYDKSLRTKAFSVVYSFISILGAMKGVYKEETMALMSEMLQLWVAQFCDVLRHPVQSEDPEDWCIRMEVLKCVNQLLQNFPSLMDAHFTVILGPLWQTFVSSLGVYDRASIKGLEDAFEGRYDSDGSDNSLESFVMQVLETLSTIVGSRRFKKVIACNVKELVCYTIAVLQMTEQQVHTWSLDANQYLADEDDSNFSCRVSGALLIEEVITSFGAAGIEAVLDSARRRFSESQRAKASGDANWWRMREATIFALAFVSDQLLEVEDSEVTNNSLKNLIEQTFAEDMTTGMHEYPFLHARMFSAVAKFYTVINMKEQYLLTCFKAVGMDVPPPVKIGACQALSQLLPDVNSETLQPHMSGLFSSLIDLLNHASEETMHLVLESLRAAAIAGQRSLASLEHILSPIILNMWISHVSDPFISIDALDVLEAIKDAPGCIHPLVSRVLPFTTSILNNPHQQPDGLVSGSLDLLSMLLKNAPKDVVRAIVEASFAPISLIVLQSDDHSEAQNATQCLASLISGGKEELLEWCGDSGLAMRTLLDVASRLLDPDRESSGSLFVGMFVLQLILHLPSQMAQHFRGLVIALIRRMQSCDSLGLRSSLLLIFARLVHMSLPQVENFIDLLVSIPADAYGNSFTYLMSEWTKYQGEIQGAYQIKVTTTALALLLSTRHAELVKINVQGRLIKSHVGITTRSRVRAAPDQWTVMPLPAKILAILADAILEIQEQLEGDEEDSDWEDVQGDIGNGVEYLHMAAATSHSRPSDSYLDAMAKAFNEDDDCEDDLLSGADPLNQINLVKYLVEFLVKFSQSDSPLLNSLMQSLTTSQQNAIQRVLNR